VDQHSTSERALISTENAVVWTSHPDDGAGTYIAIFNIGDNAQTLHYSWKELGLSGTSYKVRDLWQRKNLGAAKEVNITLPSHACVLYRARKQ
ncbi:MAG: glycoside hydrolase family 27 protein, partial [Terriglobales bacterium]